MTYVFEEGWDEGLLELVTNHLFPPKPLTLDMEELFSSSDLTDEEERTILEVRAEIASRVMDNSRLAIMFEALHIPDVSKYTPAELNRHLDQTDQYGISH